MPRFNVRVRVQYIKDGEVRGRDEAEATEKAQRSAETECKLHFGPSVECQATILGVDRMGD